MNSPKFSQEVNSLSYICFYTALRNVPKNIDWVALSSLPPDLKKKFLACFCSRRLVTDSSISYLVDNQTTDVVLSGCDISNEGLKKLVVCRHMGHLDLSEPLRNLKNINSGIGRVFSSCTNLTFVSLRNCVKVTDVTIHALAFNSPKLAFLNLSGCRLIGDEALDSLSQFCHALQGLELSNTKVSDAGVIRVAHSSCAKTLKEFGVGFCTNVTIHSIAVLGTRCSNLNVLKFHRIPDSVSEDLLAFEANWSERGKLLGYTYQM